MWRFYFSFIAAWWNTLKRWDLHILCCCNWSRNLVWQFRTFAINARLRVQTTGAHAVKHDDIWWIDLQKFSLKFWHVVFINKVNSGGSKGCLRPKMFSIWQNHMLVSPSRRVGTPSYREAWIRSWQFNVEVDKLFPKKKCVKAKWLQEFVVEVLQFNSQNLTV